MFKGIPNRGSTCYANAVLQCLRRCLVGYTYERMMLERYITGGQSILPHIGNIPSDAHEFYGYLMEHILPREVSYLFLWDQYGYSISHIDDIGGDPPRIMCMYKNLQDISISLWSQLNMPPIYRLVACVCYTSEHYYALLRDGNSDTWYIANDSVISVCTTPRHPVCMLFYICT